jgi:hypothetical protein
MRLTADDFIRRFLPHVLPKRFVRIRHYGLLAGRNVTTHLARCRQLLAVPDVPPSLERTWLDRVREWTGEDPSCCPRCQGPLTLRAFDGAPTAAIRPRGQRHALGAVDSS